MAAFLSGLGVRLKALKVSNERQSAPRYAHDRELAAKPSGNDGSRTPASLAQQNIVVAIEHEIASLPLSVAELSSRRVRQAAMQT